jgi:hypothetical protein
MLSRLLRMGIGEVSDRSRQEAAKWLERRGLALRRSSQPFDWLDDADRARPRFSRQDTAQASQRVLEAFKSKGPARFFEGATDVLTPAKVAACAPLLRARVVSAAEAIVLGRFELLGHRDLDFGQPIDWRLDPLSQRRSPLVHWSLIDPTAAAVLGDSKLVWELNRLQHFVTLGVAYRMTSDERFSEAFVRLSKEWIQANPIGLGINWASSLEAAFRVVSWCWALFLFRTSRQLTPSVFLEIADTIDAHATHIERYLSRHSSPNTHLTGEALGLVYAGMLFPDSKSSRRRKAIGREILDNQIRSQVLQDGVYFEQSTAYQIYTVDIYLHYLILSARSRVHVPSNVNQAVQRMLDVLLALRRPDGSMPAIGDADGGRLLPLCPRTPADTRGLFATAAVFFGRAEYAWAANGIQPEAVWLLGPGAQDALEALGATPPSEGSRVFSNGGYVVMRSGWRRDAHHLIFDVGPLGCPSTAAHGHADLLSVQVNPFGEPCVVDPGTYMYAASPLLRDHFRSTSAHSTVTVDGIGQAEPAGIFHWRERPCAKLNRFLSTDEADFADGSHDGYARLDDPVVHRRRVLFSKSHGYWVIVDDLLGATEHRVDLRFQFAPLPVRILPDGWVRAVGPRGRGLLVRTFSARPFETRIGEGAEAPFEGWVSPDYGQREAAPVLIHSATTALPLRFLTVLVPSAHATQTPPAVRSLRDPDGVPSGLVFGDSGQTVRFGADSFTWTGADPCEA